MPSIAEIRNMYPDAKDASDEQIISWTAQRAGMSLQDAAEYFGISSGKKKNAALAGLSSGYEDTKGIFNSTGAALADVAGVDSIRDYFNKKSESNQIRSEIEGRPDLERVEDQSLGSALPYLAYQTGKQATNLVGGIAAGVLTPEVAVPAWLARGAAIAPRAIGGGGAAARVAAATAEGTSTFAARRAAAEAGQTFGKQVVGGAAFNEAQSIGSLYQNSVENPEDQNPGLTALKMSPLYALAETLPEAGLAGRFGHGSGFTGNFLQRAGKNALMSGASGATSELSQTAMEINVGKPQTAEQEFSQYLNAGVAGGAVEGLVGGLTGGFHKAHGKSLIEGGNTPANEIQQAFQQNPTITPVGTTPGFDMAAQMSGTAGRVDPLTGRSSLVGTQAGTTPEFDMAAHMGGTADRVNPLAGRSSLVDQTAAPITAPAVTGGTTDIAQAQATAQQQNQQVDQAQKEQAAREDAFSKIGAVYNPEGQGSLQIFGQTILGPQVNTFGTALASKVAALPDHAHEITNAIAQANTALATKEKPSPLVSFTYNGNNPVGSADKAMQALAKTTDKFQIGHVDSVQMAADNLNTLSVTAKGNQLEQINAIHEALTGRDTDGYIASQQTKGAKNGQQQQQLQTTSGLGNVSVEGGTGEVSGTNAGDVRPSGVQSLLTGSQPQGQTSQQTGQPAGEGIRTGTSVATDLSGSQQPGQVNEQATSGLGEGQVPNQPQQTATGAVGEQAVQNGPRVYSPTIGYYASDLSHISSERRIEVIRELFGKILASVKGANAETRTEILRLSLLEQFKEKDIADLVGMSEAAVQKQLERMGIKMDRTIGQYVVADPDIATKMVTEAANFRSAEFPDGIGEGELAGLYATRSEYEANKSQTLAEELEAGEQEGDRSKLLAEEMNRGEGGEDRTMGTIAKAGGSQGAVDSEGNAFFDKMEKLKAELDAMPEKDPRRTQLEKKIKDQWAAYGKQQAERGTAGEVTVTPEGEEDAVQVESADEGNVRKPARGGKTVGEGNTKPEKPAKQTKQAKTEAVPEEIKTPEEQWNELRTLAPELPAYADLNKDQRIRFDDLANRGKANLAAVVNQIVTAPATEIATEKRQTISDVAAEAEKPTETKAEDQPKFGKSTAPTKPYTAQSLIAELKAFMRVDSLGRNVIIVDDVAELEDMRDQAIGWSNDKAFGWTRSGKAILVASRIQEGQGRAKFMHEVGSHLGLDRMLAEKDIVSLAGQISKWADLNDNSKESVLARKAIERVGNANVADEDVMSELIAYFVEEAMQSGVDPSAAAKMTGAFGSWFRTLWAGFKNAVRKLGFKPESLTAQDVVNMAYGAARLEVAGTWHGSNAEFRSFSAKKIGTGAGGQLWGKGTYLADARATSEGFAAIDDDSMQGTKAALYRVDTAVTNDEWLNAKQPMNAQSDTVRKGLESLRLYDPAGEASIKWFKTQEAKYGAEQFATMLDKVGVKGVKYPDASGGFSFVVFNNKNINRVQTNVGVQTNGANDAVPKFDWQNVKFGINPAATVDETINRLPPFVRTPTRNLVTNLLHQAKNAVYASAITEDVVKLASKYMKSANDYLNAQYARQATRIEFEQRINSILSDFDKLSGEYKGTGANSVNKFIKDSTVSGKWGYYPGEHRVGTDLFTVDPDMKLRFDAFDESAQKVIKAVFEHGYEALMLKKKAVEAAIDREFADREKAVMGDAEQMKELAAEKKLLLAREAKVRGVDVSSPYAYLGRYGDHVVVAKSAEFKHYEERAKLGDWDVEQAKQWLQDNVSNSDHYVVQFAETQAEADNIAEKLHATGKYDIMPEDAGVKEAEESYTGGGNIHLAVGRLRNLLQRQVSDGDMSSVNFHSMNKMVGDLYLMTVAEASARKSEMQRKNVSGADDNMMRNLATSGRADAHFLSSLEHNDAITDSMERMRNEARNHRREAMPIYNELIKRQANSMEYKSPGPLSVALTRMNTLWSLTFSPAFYLQQVTQTAVISVPYLAGRIGYGNAVSQVNRGYKEIAGLIKGLGINEHIDFSKAPADVRDMLNKLVGMGKIDISMDSAERATADEKGVFAKVMYKMQGVNNRIEAVNRSVAAIAAYRGYLEKYGNNNTEAATQYAAQVVSDTHGSYDGFNTPRALTGAIGKVVGQFRRFQIIQLSMLARLMHNSFKGASTEEKMVARKALGFIVAQMSVLGGAMAVPFMSQIAWMMSKILGDPDEPEDYEFKLRRLINNKVVSDLLLRGAPAALGVDMSDKLGMGRVASILPFAQGDLTSRSGAEKILVAAMGPSASMGMKFADAFGMLLHGDYYKGLEMAMPNGVANVMKAGRFATEGITMRNGDLVLKPEDFGMVDAAFQAVGLPTNTVTDRQFTQNVKTEYDKFYHQKSTDIKGEYVNAYRAGDAQGMAKAREEFQRLEESRVSNGYKRLPMSELLKAPMAAMKRERGVIGGVETTKQNKGFVQLASQI